MQDWDGSALGLTKMTGVEARKRIGQAELTLASIDYAQNTPYYHAMKEERLRRLLTNGYET